MELRISIRTPPGKAMEVESRFKPFIIGDKKKLHKTYCSPEDDEIIWHVEGSVKDCMRISRNLTVFDKMIRGVLDNKLMKKTLRTKLSPEDEKKLTDMLLNHTSIEVIKQASAEELVDGNKSWWTSMKEKFKEVKNNGS